MNRKVPLLVLLTLCIFSLGGFAQHTIPPSDAIKITGKIKHEVVYSIAELEILPKTEIGDQIIYNHKGEVKDTLYHLKGITLKNLLAAIEFSYDKPKELNEFYFVFTATDGYRVVFSWNEIYNSESGDHFFVVTEMNGKKLKEMEQRILFISNADFKSGRRYIKALSSIDIRQLD